MNTTLADAFSFAGAISAATDGNGDTSRQMTLAGVAIGLQVVSFIVVCARLFARMFVTQQSGTDDRLILAAAIISIAYTTMVGLTAAAGAGMHADALTKDQQDHIDHFSWYCSMIHSIAAMLVRGSLLVFFLRLFPSRSVRIVSIVLLVLSTAFGVGWFFAVVFQCVPLGDAEIKRCIDFPLFYRSIAIISMVLDFAILLTPIPSLYKVVLPWRARLSVILVFVISFVPCIASVFRVYLATDKGPGDSFYQLGLQLIWASAELHMAIICACVAGLKPLFTRFLPSVIGTSWLTSDGRQPTSGLASYGKRTGTFSHCRPHAGRTDPLELCNINSTAGGSGEVFKVQITASTQTFIDGGASVALKAERDDLSQHVREMKS